MRRLDSISLATLFLFYHHLFAVLFSFFFAQKGSVLDRLKAGDILVGDGGMTFCLEKRGYVKAGPWSPECTVESPEAG